MSKLFDSTVCLAVTFHRPGATRSFRAGEVEVVKTDGDPTEKADQSQVGANRVIFRNGFYKSACDLANEWRDWIKKRALQIPLGRVSVVPRSMLPEIKEQFENYKRRYLELADRFTNPVSYEATKDLARRRLKELWDESVYPTREKLRAKFWVDWWEMEFGQNAADALKDAEVEVIEALRMGCRALVGKLAEQLSPTPDGKKRRLFDSAVANVREFLDMFDKLNVLDDQELETLVNQAQRLVNGKFEADAFRQNDSLREVVGQKMTEITKSLDVLIQEGPRRVVSFEED
jgi:hypothetical protein